MRRRARPTGILLIPDNYLGIVGIVAFRSAKEAFAWGPRRTTFLQSYWQPDSRRIPKQTITELQIKKRLQIQRQTFCESRSRLALLSRSERRLSPKASIAHETTQLLLRLQTQNDILSYRRDFVRYLVAI